MSDPAQKAFDICVIGSGAGGAPAAAALAQKGLNVVLLERGPSYEEDDVRKNELTICRRPTLRPEGSKGVREIYYGASGPIVSNHLWTASCVGGGTQTMSGFFSRMKSEDLRPRSLGNDLPGATHLDWPISLDDLQPYYDRVASDIGLSGPDSGGPRNEPLISHPVSTLIDETCSRLGLRAYTTLRAVLAVKRDDRGPCSYSGFCGSYACQTGAKGSTKEAYIEEAEKNGNFTLLDNSYVYRLEAEGREVRRVHYFDRDNFPASVTARIVVAACGSIETARLLLNSRNADFPNGLANSSGQVGRNLTFQMPCEVTGFFDPSLFPAPNAAKSPFVQRSTDSFRVRDSKDLGIARGGTVVFLFPHPNPIQRMLTLSYNGAQRLYGRQLKDRARSYFSYNHLMSDSFIEFLPNDGTFVSLSRSTRDFWGVPAARIRISPLPQNMKDAQVMADHISRIFAAMGATGTSYNPSPFTAGELQHGTCRFGSDPATSVLDPFCRSHDIRNLFVTDASFMPSGLPIPSTFTVMANSLRVAEYIYKNG
jgi:choline dehydrogenase-like flavoprotein